MTTIYTNECAVLINERERDETDRLFLDDSESTKKDEEADGRGSRRELNHNDNNLDTKGEPLVPQRHRTCVWLSN